MHRLYDRTEVIFTDARFSEQNALFMQSAFSLKRLFAAITLIGIGAGIFAMMLRPDYAPGPIAIPVISGAFAGAIIGGGIGVLPKMQIVAWAIAGCLLGLLGVFIYLSIALEGI